MPERQTPDDYKEFHGPEFGEITDIIWDGDNTIWDWVTYAVHAYEAMSQTIADETGIPEPEVAAAMKRYYTLVGTMEDERMIQGLVAEGFFKRVPDFDQDRLICKAQKTFTDERRKYLHVYKGAHSVIKTVSEHGINNRVLTDAPKRQATARLKHVRLGKKLLKQVNALPSPDPDNLPEIFRQWEKEGKYNVDFDVTEIPWEKPYSNLEEILQMTRDQIQQHVVIIGDNDRKDMELVRRYGCRGIHAVYGETTEDLLRRLLRFAPEKVTKKNSSLGADSSSSNLPSTREQRIDLNGTPAKSNEGLIVKVPTPREIFKVLGIRPKKRK